MTPETAICLTIPAAALSGAFFKFVTRCLSPEEIGVNPRGFGMTVAVAASCSYPTRFADFLKVGAP